MPLPWQQGERSTETQKGHSGTPEIQSRSISLSSAAVVLPESLNEKHFGGRFILKCLILSNVSATVGVWHLLKQLGMRLSDLKLTSLFTFFWKWKHFQFQSMSVIYPKAKKAAYKQQSSASIEEVNKTDLNFLKDDDMYWSYSVLSHDWLLDCAPPWLAQEIWNCWGE